MKAPRLAPLVGLVGAAALAWAQPRPPVAPDAGAEVDRVRACFAPGRTQEEIQRCIAAALREPLSRQGCAELRAILATLRARGDHDGAEAAAREYRARCELRADAAAPPWNDPHPPAPDDRAAQP